MLRVLVVAELKKKRSVIKEIKSRKLGSVATIDKDEVYVRIDSPPTTAAERDVLRGKFEEIDGVLRASTLSPHLNIAGKTLRDALRAGRCAFFFDVDSTLTQGGPGTVHHSILDIFNKMADRGIWIFFATGRSIPDLAELIENYPVSRHGIAENGGIILGFGPGSRTKFGNRKEPDKVLRHLQSNYRTPEDIRQGMRLTEVIFQKKDASIGRIREAVRATGAEVDIHPSKNSYHISQRGINKGTAMLELCSILGFGDRMAVAVGDADMDVPMFKRASYSFAVGNASKGAKEAADYVLDGVFEKGIEEILEIIDGV